MLEKKQYISIKLVRVRKHKGLQKHLVDADICPDKREFQKLVDDTVP